MWKQVVFAILLWAFFSRGYADSVDQKVVYIKKVLEVAEANMMRHRHLKDFLRDTGDMLGGQRIKVLIGNRTVSGPMQLGFDGTILGGKNYVYFPVDLGQLEASYPLIDLDILGWQYSGSLGKMMLLNARASVEINVYRNEMSNCLVKAVISEPVGEFNLELDLPGVLKPLSWISQFIFSKIPIIYNDLPITSILFPIAEDLKIVIEQAANRVSCN